MQIQFAYMIPIKRGCIDEWLHNMHTFAEIAWCMAMISLLAVSDHSSGDTHSMSAISLGIEAAKMHRTSLDTRVSATHGYAMSS